MDVDASHDIAALYRRACEQFRDRVSMVAPEQWHAPTPCTEWDVRTLVNHVTYEDRWTVPVLAGRTMAEVGDRFEGDLLGDDPVGANQAAATEAIAAMGAPGAMERTVHLSAGDAPATDYAWQLFADHLIHGWDLARGIGADDRLDPTLVDACAQWFAQWEDTYRGMGAIADRPQVPADADPQTALLAAFGRERSAAPGR